MERNPSKRLLTSASELKALAHPLRLDLLEAVTIHRQLTATQAAEIVGESPANCSWHLRQLAKYGYLEEVPGTTGRQRPWRRADGGGSQWRESDPDPEVEAASRALTSVFLDREISRIREARGRRQPPGWEESAFLAVQSIAWLTADEVEELAERVSELLRSYRDRITEPSTRPEGSRPIRLLALGAADDQLLAGPRSAEPNP